MNYHELVQLFFERSVALQWYWTLYVLVIGGLLGYSSFRRHKDPIKTVLVAVLFSLFAHKNLDAIHDVTMQRAAALQLIKVANPGEADGTRVREVLEPTLALSTVDYDGWFGTRNFHLFCSVLTIVALWAMERRRRQNEP
jgi:hypothetical protein